MSTLHSLGAVRVSDGTPEWLLCLLGHSGGVPGCLYCSSTDPAIRSNSDWKSLSYHSLSLSSEICSATTKTTACYGGGERMWERQRLQGETECDDGDIISIHFLFFCLCSILHGPYASFGQPGFERNNIWKCGPWRITLCWSLPRATVSNNTT